MDDQEERDAAAKDARTAFNEADADAKVSYRLFDFLKTVLAVVTVHSKTIDIFFRSFFHKNNIMRAGSGEQGTTIASYC